MVGLTQKGPASATISCQACGWSKEITAPDGEIPSTFKHSGVANGLGGAGSFLRYGAILERERHTIYHDCTREDLVVESEIDLRL